MNHHTKHTNAQARGTTSTDHITIGRNPVLTYAVMNGIAKRRNRRTVWRKIVDRLGKMLKRQTTETP